jgi:hypothetical protein
MMRMCARRRVLFTVDNPARFLLLALLLLSLTLPALAGQSDSTQVASDSAKADPPGWRVYHVKPGVDYLYEQPPNSRYYSFPVPDFKGYFQKTFTKRNIPYIGAMVIATAFLVDRDQAITDYSYHLGDLWGIKHTNHQKPVVDWSFKLGGQEIQTPLQFPQDLSSGMYFLGDGIVHSSISLGLWGYGKIWKDDRAIQTGTQCMEAILSTGIAIQILKHSFGRETNNAATAPGGKWRPFPNPIKYQRHTPNYDAMPSGHVATATTMITVIADNYPEKNWIRPVGYSLMGVLMFAMLNNGVHWASDYPLGISIGYTMAKVIDARSRTVFVDSDAQHKAGLIKTTSVSPYMEKDGGGLMWSVNF